MRVASAILLVLLGACPAVWVAAAQPGADKGPVRVGFDRLAGFKFASPADDAVVDAKKPQPSGEEQIPADIWALNGRNVVITGFMLPTKLENGKATEFLLMANQMACCFGTVPDKNDWVIVRMPRGTEVNQDVPISFYGKLRVGAVFENGYLTGIYQMDAEGEGTGG
jgi:hypothetical protein